MRRMAGTAVILGALVVGMAGIAAAQYPPNAPTVEVDPSAIACGGDVTVRGAGWLGGSQVTIVLTSDPVVLGSTAVAPDGTFRDTFRTPTPLDVARHTITVNGSASDGSPASSLATLTVTSCGGSGALAFTGSDGTIGLLQIAVVLLLVGLVLVVVMAKRRRGTELSV